MSASSNPKQGTVPRSCPRTRTSLIPEKNEIDTRESGASDIPQPLLRDTSPPWETTENSAPYTNSPSAQALSKPSNRSLYPKTDVFNASSSVPISDNHEQSIGPALRRCADHGLRALGVHNRIFNTGRLNLSVSADPDITALLMDSPLNLQGIPLRITHVDARHAEPPRLHHRLSQIGTKPLDSRTPIPRPHIRPSSAHRIDCR